MDEKIKPCFSCGKAPKDVIGIGSVRGTQTTNIYCDNEHCADKPHVYLGGTRPQTRKRAIKEWNAITEDK